MTSGKGLVTKRLVVKRVVGKRKPPWVALAGADPCCGAGLSR